MQGFVGSLKFGNYVDIVMISGQIIVSTKFYVLVTKDAFSLYPVVQAPQLVRNSISPTGLVDPSKTRWSVEFDRQASFVFTVLLDPSTRVVAPT